MPVLRHVTCSPMPWRNDMSEREIIMSPVTAVVGEISLDPRRILLDTNVLLDYVDARRDEHVTAVELMHMAVARDLYLVAPASSYKDLYYILCRSLHSEERGRALLRKLVECVPIAPLDLRGAYLAPASAGDEPDFEDGLVREIAECERVSAIITRDTAAFTGSSIPKFTPQEFLEVMGYVAG